MRDSGGLILSSLLLAPVVVLAACASNVATHDGVVVVADVDSGAPAVPKDVGPFDLSCDAAICPACAAGERGCAAEGERLIEGTCCASGDVLEHLATGRGSEVVDIETDGQHVVLCGGFGADVTRVNTSTPSKPRHLGSVSPRCQRIAFGPLLEDGTRVFYLAHHGDSWVELPFLATYHIRPDGTLRELDVKQDPLVLFEGLAYHPSGALLVAAHDGGLRAYSLDRQGVPSLSSVASDGFSNAWKVAIAESGSEAYVADAARGLVVVSVVDPLSPHLVRAVETTGSPRDVAVAAGRVYVALGGSGADVFDATKPGDPIFVDNIRVRGSAQAVAADDSIIAVAGWSHVAVYDSNDLSLVGTERLLPDFEQDLGISLADDLLFVGEWEGLHILRYHPGRVAPDLWLDRRLYTLPTGESSSRAVVVRNLGAVELEVSSISIEHPDFSVNTESLRVPPGKTGSFEFSYAPKNQSATKTALLLQTNDVDAERVEVPIIVANSERIDVGDKLTERFGFLDPSGAGQLSALKGKVTVLAYFALF